MANWSNPLTTSTYVNFVDEVKDRDLDAAKGLDPAVVTVTNPVANMIRWTSAANKWEKYSGTAWGDLSALYAISVSGTASNVTGTVLAAKGGTGQTTYAVGDILFANTTTALSRLAGVAAGNALISGGVSTAPSWGKIDLTTHVSGTLAVGNGGTGATTAAAARTALGFKRSTDIASAATLDLTTASATGDIADVTGTTTVTAITLTDGAEFTTRFIGILTLTNGASLVLPGGANITTAAGDFAVFRGYASGVVRCVSYTKASGQPVALTANIVTFTASGTYTVPAGVKAIEVEVQAGGGGGGYAASSAGLCAVGAGGAGGGYGHSFIPRSALAATVTVTVGAAGVRGDAATLTAATAGGNSSFGAHVTTNGGSGGGASSATSVLGGSANGPFGALEGAGGSIMNAGGSSGGRGIVFSSAIAFSGKGGDSLLGLGGKDVGVTTAGGDGTGYGAGGGGGAATGASNADGGHGRPGLVIIREYY
jgi:hypothetical protein